MPSHASCCPLQLTQEARPLKNAPHIRTDLKLLEVDNSLLDEILTNGCALKIGHDWSATQACSLYLQQLLQIRLLHFGSATAILPPVDACVPTPLLPTGLLSKAHRLGTRL